MVCPICLGGRGFRRCGDEPGSWLRLTQMAVYDVSGTGSLLYGVPTIWGSILGVPSNREPPDGPGAGSI